MRKNGFLDRKNFTDRGGHIPILFFFKKKIFFFLFLFSKQKYKNIYMVYGWLLVTFTVFTKKYTDSLIHQIIASKIHFFFLLLKKKSIIQKKSLLQLTLSHITNPPLFFCWRFRNDSDTQRNYCLQTDC